MRPVSILVLFALTSSVPHRTDGKADATSTNSDPTQNTRSLRVGQDTESREEERGPINFVETIAKQYSKLDDAVKGELKKMTTVDDAVTKEATGATKEGQRLEKAAKLKNAVKRERLPEETRSLEGKFRKAYPDLDDDGVKKLVAAFEKTPPGFSKENLYVQMNHKDPNIVSVSPVYMRPREGREGSVITKINGKDRKVTTGGVIYRDNENGLREFLLISGSSSKKPKFMLTKGTFEQGESLEQSAMREMIEEGGNLVKLEKQLKQEVGDTSVFKPFIAKSYKQYDNFAENARGRVWLAEDQIKAVLKEDKMMSNVFQKAVAALKKKDYEPEEELLIQRLNGLGKDDLEKLNVPNVEAILKKEMPLRKEAVKKLMTAEDGPASYRNLGNDAQV